MIRHTVRSLLLLLSPLLVGCGAARVESLSSTEQPAAKVVVLAAASLTEAFTDIGRAFGEEHAGVEVILSFGSSSQLSGQIVLGAPADVFASASPVQMQTVSEAGRVAPGSVRLFASNRLVVVCSRSSRVPIQTLWDLAAPGVHLVLAAPDVPVGQYAQEFLRKAADDPLYGEVFASQVAANVVSYEATVRAVLTKVSLGEADGGIVFVSDLRAVDESTITSIDIPDPLNVVAAYVIAPLSDADQPEGARAFVEFVLSPSGQSILAQYGFMPAGE
ncbi:MAG: molybdate ABC transporter substrate-binding protein [Chloroflexota bacterium]